MQLKYPKLKWKLSTHLELNINYKITTPFLQTIQIQLNTLTTWRQILKLCIKTSKISIKDSVIPKYTIINTPQSIKLNALDYYWDLK